MKIALYSDLHLEFLSSVETFPEFKTDADVVVLAGDIGAGDEGVKWAKREFEQPVVIIAGNHEHYGRNLRQTLRVCYKAAEGSHVHFLEDDEVVIDGVRFLGCTLWTDLDLWGEDERERCAVYADRYINDFRVIKYGIDEHNLMDRKLTPMRMRDIHLESRAWLGHEFDNGFDGKTVVISHHLPSIKSVAERFLTDERDSLITAAFASRLDAEIEKWQPDLWLHGHTHDSCDYRIGRTRVVCNPRGYPRGRSENPRFDAGMVLEF